MADDVRPIKIENLPTTQNGALKVELVPMLRGITLGGGLAATTRKNKDRDTVRFWITILSLIISIISVVVTATVAIVTIRHAR